jgi:hypothetical protein
VTLDAVNARALEFAENQRKALQIVEVRASQRKLWVLRIGKAQELGVVIVR